MSYSRTRARACMEKRLFPVDIPSGWLCPAQFDRILLSRMRRHTRNSCPAARTYCALFFYHPIVVYTAVFFGWFMLSQTIEKHPADVLPSGCIIVIFICGSRLPLYCSTGWSKISSWPSLTLHFLDKHSISDFSVPAPAHADADPHREMHLLPGLFQMHNHFPAESH